MVLKILNLYAGIGGNRKLWGGDIEVTAIEIDPKIAKIYQDFFPNDKVIVGDAHKYLLEHFKEFDFIWSSPPCPTHSRIRKAFENRHPPVFPDMDLYSEIIFLKHYFKGKWLVENVRSFYDPLIIPVEFGSHFFWCNFVLGKIETKDRAHDKGIKELTKRKGFVLDGEDIDKRKALRNCVEPELGAHIFKMAFKEPQTQL